eukprot:3178224-Prymnesium_polylepis.1
MATNGNGEASWPTDRFGTKFSIPDQVKRFATAKETVCAAAQPAARERSALSLPRRTTRHGVPVQASEPRVPPLCARSQNDTAYLDITTVYDGSGYKDKK